MGVAGRLSGTVSPFMGRGSWQATIRRVGPWGHKESDKTECGRHQGILQLVCSFIERAFMATSSDAHMATELGYLFILQDQVKEASLWYSKAMKLDESSVAALTGLGRLGRERGGRLGSGSQAG